MLQQLLALNKQHKWLLRSPQWGEGVRLEETEAEVSAKQPVPTKGAERVKQKDKRFQKQDRKAKDPFRHWKPKPYHSIVALLATGVFAMLETSMLLLMLLLALILDKGSGWATELFASAGTFLVKGLTWLCKTAEGTGLEHPLSRQEQRRLQKAIRLGIGSSSWLRHASLR